MSSRRVAARHFPLPLLPVYKYLMAATSTPTAHTITITTFANGAPAKARRAKCSCGKLGARFAYGPAAGRTLAKATEKAEKDGAAHLDGEW